ncbi:sialin isoform X1 [Procambarus clarkii]|uniref:sialin isoform X1 n=1 Tax=Procambarus clarkii TaxID=6728 RepID=UPI003743438E
MITVCEAERREERPSTGYVSIGQPVYDDEDRSNKGVYWGVRHTLAALGALSVTLLYTVRLSTSSAILSMVRHQNTTTTENPTSLANFSSLTNHTPLANFTNMANHTSFVKHARIISHHIIANLSNLANDGNLVNPATEAILEGRVEEGECPTPRPHHRRHHTGGEFDWDDQTQELVLGSFFWGYAASTFLGGVAAEHFGGHLVFGLGVLLSSLVSLMGPVCARTSLPLFIASRVLMGLMQGVTLPAITSLLATWVTPAEKSKFSALVFSGLQLGPVIALSTSDWLCGSGFLDGWPSVFYIFGAVGVVVGGAWLLVVLDRPEHHPRISRVELKYIQAQRGSLKSANLVPLPWRAVWTSLPFWALLMASMGDEFCFSILISEMPIYLRRIQHFDIDRAGVLVVAPYLVMLVAGLLWAALVDRLTAANTLSIDTVRRLSMGVALHCPAMVFLGMCFVDCWPELSVAMLCLSMGLNGTKSSGHLCSHQELAPNLAGTLLGITNTGASIMSIAAPALVGFITYRDRQISLPPANGVGVEDCVPHVRRCVLLLQRLLHGVHHNGGATLERTRLRESILRGRAYRRRRLEKPMVAIRLHLHSQLLQQVDIDFVEKQEI